MEEERGRKHREFRNAPSFSPCSGAMLLRHCAVKLELLRMRGAIYERIHGVGSD